MTWNPDGELTWSVMEKATELNVFFFTSVFAQEEGNIPADILFTPNIFELIANLVITEEDVASPCEILAVS